MRLMRRPPLRLAADPADADLPGIRQSVRVATVAKALDMHERDVRQLIDDGELETHRKGKRGVRVYIDSVAAYQLRQARPSCRQKEVISDARASPEEHAAHRTPGYREALAYLAKLGIG
jgi:excisionase family DNA binding protein